MSPGTTATSAAAISVCHLVVDVAAADEHSAKEDIAMQLQVQWRTLSSASLTTRDG